MIRDTLRTEIKESPEYHSCGIRQEDLVRLTAEVNNLTEMQPFEIDEDNPFEFVGSLKGKGSARYQRRSTEFLIMSFRIKDVSDDIYVLPAKVIEQIQRLWDAIKMASAPKKLGLFLEDRMEVSGYVTRDNKTARRVSFTFTYLPEAAVKFDEWLKEQVLAFEEKLKKEPNMTDEERQAARVEFAKSLNLRGV